MLFLILPLISSSQQDCPVFIYSSTKSGICFSPDPSSNSIVVNPCLNSNSCSFNPYNFTYFGYCTGSENGIIDAMPGLPGAKCSESHPCIDEVGVECVLGFCEGLKPSSSCNFTDQCDPGLYCNIVNNVGTCQPLINPGKPCTSSGFCTYGYGCHFGFCVNSFSLSSGVELDKGSCVFGRSDLCESQNCYNEPNGKSLCINPFVNQQKTEIPCIECVGVSVTSNLTLTERLECECGFDGKAYCPEFTGDVYQLKLNSLYEKFVVSEYYTKCNILGGLDCIWSYGGSDVYWEFVYYWNVINYAYLVAGADERIVKVLLPEYSLAESNYDDIEDEEDIGYFLYTFSLICII